MKLKWERIGRSGNAEESTTSYQAAGTDLYIESRKRQIPHANGVGSWTYTSYFVLVNKKEVAEKQRLSYAQEYAERIYEGGQDGREKNSSP